MTENNFLWNNTGQVLNCQKAEVMTMRHTKS